jgi:hypothetical protein
MNPKRLFLYLFIASVSLSALIGIGVILFGNFGDREVRVLMTTLTITVTSILGLACGAYLERKNSLLPVAGIIVAVIAALLWLVVIWSKGRPPGEGYIKTTVTLTVLACACSHLSLLSMAQLEKKFAWARPVAHFLIWSLAGFIIIVVWAEPADYEVISRIMGVLAILVAVVTIVTPVFHKLSAVETGADIDAEIEALKLKIQELERKKSQLNAIRID